MDELGGRSSRDSEVIYPAGAFGLARGAGERRLQLDDDWRHMVDWTECVREGHLPVVTLGGFWLWPRFWLRCWRCELKLGPWKRRETAERARRLFDRVGYRS